MVIVHLSRPIAHKGRVISSLKLLVPNARRRRALAREVMGLPAGPAAARILVAGCTIGIPRAWIDQLSDFDLVQAANAATALLDNPKLWK